MENMRAPALTPLEGAMLPAIELKQAQNKPFAALHAALARWPARTADLRTGARMHARRKDEAVRARLLSRAAYAYAVGKRKT